MCLCDAHCPLPHQGWTRHHALFRAFPASAAARLLRDLFSFPHLSSLGNPVPFLSCCSWWHHRVRGRVWGRQPQPWGGEGWCVQWPSVSVLLPNPAWVLPPQCWASPGQSQSCSRWGQGSNLVSDWAVGACLRGWALRSTSHAEPRPAVWGGRAGQAPWHRVCSHRGHAAVQVL